MHQNPECRESSFLNYYLIAPLGQNSPLLTYICDEPCQIGQICLIPLKNKMTQGVVLSATSKPDFECKIATKTTHYFLPHQQLLARFIASYYCASIGESYKLFTPFDKISQSQTIFEEIKDLTLQPLSESQNKALAFLQTHHNPLLFGDTGSGKTEIYIHLIAQTLAQGKNALFLMPEISLTPQIEARLKKVFGQKVGIWHSKITQRKKKEMLLKLAQGQIRVIAGARSALFLPIVSLGLVVIDEEHDDAYKSQMRPRYNARDVALYLGAKNEIKIILGSATPSLNSYYRATNDKNMYRLKGQYFNAHKTFVFESPHTPTDSCENDRILSATLLSKMQEVLDRQEQIIVFLPTRANYKMLLCERCGEGIKCEFCAVNMSLHTDKNALICHYCHWSKPIISLCPHCHSPTLRSLRIGTAEVAKYLCEIFPKKRIEVFDRDHITTHRKLTGVLEDFNNGKIDILVGTHMLSKGHDYHKVNLAVILGIDYILGASDYRGNERALSLVHQIAGRSGRKHHGEVYIQSAKSDFLKKFMADYEIFLRYELSARPKLYPPYMRLANITFAHHIESKASQALHQSLEILKRKPHSEVEIVGHSRAMIQRLYGKFRFVLLLRSHSPRALLDMLHDFVSQSPLELQRIYEIDIDPLNVL